MTFEEYAATMSWRTVAERIKAKAVWHYQQASIDGLKDELHCVRAYNDELIAELERLKRPISDDQATCRTCGAPINDWYVFDLSTVKQLSSNGQANGGE